MGCTQRIVFNCIWLYIFPCRKVQWNVHSLLKTSFYLDLTFYVCLPTCVQVYICQLKGWMQVLAVWSMLKWSGWDKMKWMQVFTIFLGSFVQCGLCRNKSFIAYLNLFYGYVLYIVCNFTVILLITGNLLDGNSIFQSSCQSFNVPSHQEQRKAILPTSWN